MRDQESAAANWQAFVDQVNEMGQYEERIVLFDGRAVVVTLASERDIKRISAGVVMD